MASEQPGVAAPVYPPHSATISNLAAALVQASTDLKNIDKPTKGYEYRYTKLERLLEVHKPILSRHGLTLVQLPYGERGEVGVTSMLLHESGEYLCCSVSLPLNADKRGRSLEQAAGGVITYLRRYTQKSMLAVESDEGVDPDALDHSLDVGVSAPRPHEDEANDIWDSALAMAKKAKTKKELQACWEKYLNGLRTSGLPAPDDEASAKKALIEASQVKS